MNSNFWLPPQRWSFFVCYLILVLLQGCAKVSTIRSAPDEMKLVNYKRAYIYALNDDEWQINQSLSYELANMGIAVVGIPFKDPTKQDLLVKYQFDSGWDIEKYLKSFQIQLIDAQSGFIVASTSYRSNGIWLGKRDGRLEAAFNDLREKNGLPRTKQFD